MANAPRRSPRERIKIQSPHPTAPPPHRAPKTETVKAEEDTVAKQAESVRVLTLANELIELIALNPWRRLTS